MQLTLKKEGMKRGNGGGGVGESDGSGQSGTKEERFISWKK